MAFEDGQELGLLDDSVAIFIDLAEDSLEVIFIAVGVELRGDVGVDNCFEFVLEVEGF